MRSPPESPLGKPESVREPSPPSLPSPPGNGPPNEATPTSEEGAPSRLARLLGVAIPLALACAVAFVPSALHRVEGRGAAPAYGAALALLMAGLWIAESIPMAWTALLPLVVAPLAGLYGSDPATALARAAEPYADGYLALFLGGMVLGAGMEESGLHRRLALSILLRVGHTRERLLLGLLVATGFVSLWISNTATAVMMAPIALGLVRELGVGPSPGHRAPATSTSTALLLAVAYGSNVGGIGTKIGTSTNSIYCGVVEKQLGVEVGFARFSLVALPFTLLLLPAAWFALSRLARADGPIESRGRDAVSHALAALGPVSRPERKVALVFGAAASLWVLGEAVRPLLAPLAKALGASGLSSKHYEAAVSVLAGLVLVAARGVRWASLRAVPWSALVLLGGSFAMAQAIDASGLGAWMGAELAGIASLPAAAQLLAVSFGSIGLSAVASNTATINVALAVLPRSLPLWTAAMLGASCDFMLPAGTPPNAIVFGTGAVRLRTMVRAGLVLDVVAALLVAAYVHVYARHVLPSLLP